jgi:hypothetical protein
MSNENVQGSLTPLDFQQLLTPFDSKAGGRQPEAEFWRKEDKNGHFVTPPIIKHSGVQKLARLFGVLVTGVTWVHRDIGALELTSEVKVEGYAPLNPTQASRLIGRPITLSTSYTVPPQTTGIGELNAANAGVVGKTFPQCLCYKRAYDRAVLDHLGLHCYGESEEPRFAQGADYEESEEAAPRTPPAPRISNEQYRALPKDVQDLSVELAKVEPGFKAKLALIYQDCAGDVEQIRAALQEWKAKHGG